jgi:hypothetical protein
VRRHIGAHQREVALAVGLDEMGLEGLQVHALGAQFALVLAPEVIDEKPVIAEPAGLGAFANDQDLGSKL